MDKVTGLRAVELGEPGGDGALLIIPLFLQVGDPLGEVVHLAGDHLLLVEEDGQFVDAAIQIGHHPGIGGGEQVCDAVVDAAVDGLRPGDAALT